MEKEKLVEFIETHGTKDDNLINLLEIEDAQLRTIVQRLISEKRVSLQNETRTLMHF